MTLHRYLIGLILVLLTGLWWGTTHLQAQEPEVSFVTGRLTLNGTPDMPLHFPVELQAGPAGAEAVHLSIEALSDPTQPGQVLLGDIISFQPARFELEPGEQRRVWGSIAALPSTPGSYEGTLVAQYGLSPTLRSAIPVSLTVRFAQVVPDSPQIRLVGHSGNLARTLRLTAVDGPAAGINLTAAELIETGGQRTITPDQLSLSPAGFSLAPQETQIVTLKVTGDVEPGTYQGEVYFPQTNQPLAGLQPISLTVEVLPLPILNLPLGKAVSAQLVRCTSSLDCWLARLLLPVDYRQAGLALQVENSDLVPVQLTDIQSTLARVGPVNVTGQANILDPPSLPLSVGAHQAQDIRLAVDTTAGPGHYQGDVTLHLADATGRPAPAQKQTVAVEVNIRNGPLIAILLILLGILAGRVVQWLSREQTRQLRLYYRLRGQTKNQEQQLSEADRQRVEADALTLRQRIYERDLEGLEGQLRAFSLRPSRLIRLDQALPQIEQACQEQQLTEADRQSLKAVGEQLRQKIHADEPVNVEEAVSAIANRAEGLGRLREVADSIGDDLPLSDQEWLRGMVEVARTALLQGDDQAAATGHDNVRRARDLLPQLQNLKAEVETRFEEQPDRLDLLEMELELTHRAILNLEFDQAQHWLDRLRLHLRHWQSEIVSVYDEERMGDKESYILPAVTSMGEILAGLRQELAGWQPLAFLGSRQPVTVEPSLPQPGLDWREWLAVRWHGFRTAVWSEISLWLINPLVWFITMLITALIGFQVLYVTGAATFGADPLRDYLPLLLWGLTSDVTGATLSSLTGLGRKA